MKKSLISGFIAFAVVSALSSGLLSTGLLAETYVAELSGVECDGCKKTISKSLAKLSSVETIRIEKIGEEKHKMTVTTDGSAPITEEQAAKAIELAEHYKILSWSKSTDPQPEAHPHAHETPEKTESWLVNGWDKMVGTWQEEDGPTISFTWKFPGHVLESFVKWGESEKYSIMWSHAKTGEISILSTDNKGGHSKGTCVFEADKAVFKDSYVASNGKTGDKVTVYTFDGDNLAFSINDGKPRVMSRK